MNRRHVVLILNPTSGRGKGARRRSDLEHALSEAATAAKSLGIEASFDIAETQAPGEAVVTGEMARGSGSWLAREAAEAGADVIAAAGGDGTLTEVLNGVVETDAALGIVPLGTGNDFARSMGVGTDIDKAVRTLFEGAMVEVDLGRHECCPTRTTTEHVVVPPAADAADLVQPDAPRGGWFINVAGCGFDAVVAERINRGYRFLNGTAAYLAATASTLLNFKASELHITIDGRVLERRAMLCAVANARSYGGGMNVAPQADYTDGLFDVVIVGDVGRLEFVRAFPQVFKGTHISHPKVEVLRGKDVRIEAGQLPVLVDGESVGTTPARFVLEPKKVHVVHPI